MNVAFTPSLRIKWDSIPTEIPEQSDSESEATSRHQLTVQLGLIPTAFSQQPSSQQAASQPASQRRQAQSAASASPRMPPHGGPPAPSYSHRLATRLLSGLATMQMDNLRRKPGAIVLPGACLRARTEVEFGSIAPTRRVSLIATSVTTSRPTSPPVLRFVLKDLDSSFSHPPTSYSNVYLLTTRW